MVRGLRNWILNSPEASKTINDWVRKQTKEKIEKIVDDIIEPDTIMYIINALYFKGSWTHKFDPKLTQEELFFLEDGTEKSCFMMFQSDQEYPYYEGENFQAVSLPYGKGRLSMVLFLPDEGLVCRSSARELRLRNGTNGWIHSLIPRGKSVCLNLK